MSVPCRRCPLGTDPIVRSVPFGPTDAEAAIVGINPSTSAIDDLGAFGIPFLARLQHRGEAPTSVAARGSTRAVYALAEEAGVDLGAVYSLNLVRCSSPGNRVPATKEWMQCRTNAIEALGALPNLRRVVLYGRVVGAALGFDDFGQMKVIEGTIATGTLLRHPVSVLRRWTTLRREARKLREALEGTSALGPSF